MGMNILNAKTPQEEWVSYISYFKCSYQLTSQMYPGCTVHA